MNSRAAEFEAAVINGRSKLIRFALRILKDPDDAEEAVQKALFKAWCGLADFRGEATITTWLIHIVINESLMKTQYSKIRRVKSDEVKRQYYLPLDAPNPEQLHLNAEIRELVRRDIHRAPRIFRAALLTDLLSILEIGEAEPIAVLARRSNLSCGAAKTLRIRARRWLRSRMLQYRDARAI